MSSQPEAEAALRVVAAGADLESLARLEALFVSAPLGIGFLDRALRVERVNTALANVVGREASACRGLTIAELVPGLARLLVPVIEQVAARGEAIPELEFSGEAPTSPGTVRHWLAAFFPVLTGARASAGLRINNPAIT